MENNSKDTSLLNDRKNFLRPINLPINAITPGPLPNPYLFKHDPHSSSFINSLISSGSPPHKGLLYHPVPRIQGPHVYFWNWDLEFPLNLPASTFLNCLFLQKLHSLFLKFSHSRVHTDVNPTTAAKTAHLGGQAGNLSTIPNVSRDLQQVTVPSEFQALPSVKQGVRSPFQG